MGLAIDWSWIGLVALTFFMAGIVKGVIGLGLPTIAMALLSALIVPAQAAAMIVLPTLLTNLWQMLDGPYLRRILVRLWPMMASVVVGTLLTARIISNTDSRLSIALVGVVLIVYAATGLAGWKVRIPAHMEGVLTPAAGLTTGLVNGATAIFVLPTVPYLQGIGLDKDEMVQAFGLFAFMASTALGVGLGAHGVIGSDLFAPAAAAVATSFAGMAVGRHLRQRLSIEKFRRAVLVGLALLGASMVHRGFK